MRLTASEQMAIADAARSTLGPGACVSLFGSRVDDDARGGDIDLLVETASSWSASEWVSLRSAFISKLYRSIGERRIDVVLAAPPALAPPPAVLASARQQAIELVRT